MIIHIQNEKIDKVKWDQCISQSANGNVYAFSWYLDVICPGWDAMVEDDYSAVMPLSRGRKYMMNYIYPPFFAQQLGVFSGEKLTDKKCSEFFHAIPGTFRFVEMNLNTGNSYNGSLYDVIENTDIILNFEKDYHAIAQSYSENHRRNLKKAGNNGLRIFKAGKVDTVINMFRANRGKEITNLQNHHYDMLRQLVTVVGKNQESKVWIVDDGNGIPCAGAVFFESHNTGIFIFSGITSGGRASSAMHFLVDAYIREQQGRLKRLDFEGSNNPDLARFYRGFGAREYVYLQIRKNKLPPPWKWFKK